MTAFVDQLIVLIVRAVYPTAISLTPHRVLLLKICRVDGERNTAADRVGLYEIEEPNFKILIPNGPWLYQERQARRHPGHAGI
jgi:hypothetical protein